jgi:hypothetical protein
METTLINVQANLTKICMSIIITYKEELYFALT